MWLLSVCIPCVVGYENEVLMSEVAQVQAYRDRIDEMDGISLNIAQLEKTNARCRLCSAHQSGLHCRGMQSSAGVEGVVHALYAACC